MTAFEFGTKAETLARLAERVHCEAVFCPQIIVDVCDWPNRRTEIVDEIIERFAPALLVVRSSAAAEDGWSNSMAGAYHSCARVEARAATIAAAIDDVVASYGTVSPGDQVLVQPMVQDVALAGVVLTRDLNTGSGYYVINYDDHSGRTDTVTGGGESKTVLVNRRRPQAIHSPRIRKLISAVQAIEAITSSTELDIEFCTTGNNTLYILQVRPLAARQRWDGLDDDELATIIDAIRDRLHQLMKPVDGLVGSTTILGEMPDWNPVEMIGAIPRPLSASLYRRLITDQCWWQARRNMGYRSAPKPLMTMLAGRPFIDVRASFNSFLPASLPDDVAERLINVQLEALRAHPEFHDKVEFEIATTCLDFDFERSARRLREFGALDDDIACLKQHAHALTKNCLRTGLTEMNILLERTRSVPDSQDIMALLDWCRRDGTEPFSQLARHAFIGMSLLKSMLSRGVLPHEEMDAFMASIRTVASEFVTDLNAVAAGTWTRDDFLRRYGHLRPGTYDITSPRYDENPDLYLGHQIVHHEDAKSQFVLSSRSRDGIDRLLVEIDYDLNVDELMRYIATAIAAREEAKFNFTRSVSDVLKLIAAWGRPQGLSADDLSYLEIDDILNPVDQQLLADHITTRRQALKTAHKVRLPHLIMEPDDIDIVRIPMGKPTFITHLSVTAPTIILGNEMNAEVDNRIVMIESADPGYDWIFSHPIVGLVTKFGGANSHMAIRCAEFGLPAAIGCGERLFSQLSAGKTIELNCNASIVRPVESLR